VIKNGEGVYLQNRWGDYAALTIDPTNACTFWYTGQYAPAGQGPAEWRTHIGAFRLEPKPSPDCIDS
jgi:hypothetical protein